MKEDLEVNRYSKMMVMMMSRLKMTSHEICVVLMSFVADNSLCNYGMGELNFPEQGGMSDVCSHTNGHSYHSPLWEWCVG